MENSHLGSTVVFNVSEAESVKIEAMPESKKAVVKPSGVFGGQADLLDNQSGTQPGSDKIDK